MKHYTEWPMDERFELIVSKIEKEVQRNYVTIGVSFFVLGIFTATVILYLTGAL